MSQLSNAVFKKENYPILIRYLFSNEKRIIMHPDFFKNILIDPFEILEINTSIFNRNIKIETKGMPEQQQQQDPINPPHYKQHPSGIECIEVSRHFSFNLGNVIKYIWRAPFKLAQLEDLKKAAWYLNNEITKLEKELGDKEKLSSAEKST